MNMHAENFEEVCHGLGLESVEVRLLGQGKCLVVDRRISRGWLRARPCTTCGGAKRRDEVLAEHPDAFREAAR